MSKSPSTPHDESKMGTPANGFCKPFKEDPRYKREPITVRQAVEKWGDDWRLMLEQNNPFKKDYMETTTHDAIEHIDMLHMERGLKGRVEL